MATNPMYIYLNNLGDDFKKYYENKTGRTIDDETNFDVNQVVSFYGGTIEYYDLYEEVFRLNSIVYIQNQSFRIVLDKNKSEKLKNSGIDNWNLFIMDLFYFVMISRDDYSKTLEERIVYPNSDYVEAALNYRQLLNNCNLDDEVKYMNRVKGYPGTLEVRKRFVKRYDRLKKEQ